MREAPWFQVESDETAAPVYVLPWHIRTVRAIRHKPEEGEDVTRIRVRQRSGAGRLRTAVLRSGTNARRAWFGSRNARAVREGGVPMKKQLFDDLVASVKQAGKIHRGEARPSRTFIFEPDVKQIPKTPRPC